MKLFIRTLLFVFVALVTNVKVISATITFPNIQETRTSFSCHNEMPKSVFNAIENDIVNCCQNRNDLVDYRNWGIGVEANAARGTTTYTKSSLQLGRQVHQGYKANLHNPAKGLYKEFTGVKGVRPDFVDFKKRIIYELKPNNPAQIKAGWRQLGRYQSAFEKQYGGKWKTVLDRY